MNRIKSLEVNGILNAVRSLLRVAFPLITLPYVSRVLHPEGLGKFNYASTFVAYFSYLAALGISGYSIRTGAELREDSKSINEFSSEVFSINIITTFFSYLVLYLLLFFSAKVKDYSDIIIILSVSISFNTLGVEWINSIYEDFFYITIRSIIIQILTLILLFILVKSPNDLKHYAYLTVLPTIITGVINWIYVKKYCRIKITLNLNLKKHLLPILTIFLSDFAIFIYVNSDVTMLGYFTSDYHVGLYGFSTKLYAGIKTILSAIVTVSIPRLSFLHGNGKEEEFQATVSKTFTTMLTFMLPMVVGMYCISDSIIRVVGGGEYVNANTSLKLLCFALIFCEFSYIYTQCILMPLHKEKWLMYITVISALLNIGLNFIFIPKMNEVGAAVTTIIAEAFVFAASAIVVKKSIRTTELFKTVWKPLVGCLFIIITCVVIKSIHLNALNTVIISIVISMILYFAVEVKLKNESILIIMKKFLKRRKDGNIST